MLRKCVGCGHPVDVQARLCPSCGRRDPGDKHMPPTLKAGLILAFMAFCLWLWMRGGG